MRRNRPWLIAVLVLGPATARADDIATDEDVCRSRPEGTACTYDGGSGTCQATTCPTIDYSTKPPGSKQRPCSRCLPAKATAPDATPDAKPDAKPDAGAKPTSGCAIDPSAGSLGCLLLGLGLIAAARRGPRR